MVQRKPIITLILITINVLAYAFVSGRSGNWWFPELRSMLDSGANFSGLTLDGQWWRMFSCMFLHFGPVHLAVNMLALYSLGADLEDEMGGIAFLFVYFACGLSASVSSLLFNDFVVSAGASGAIFGLFGVHFTALLFGAARGQKGFIRHFFSALIMLGINLWLGFKFDFIDNAAHLGGFAGGIFIGSVYHILLRVEKNRLLVLSFASVITFIAGFILFITIPKFPAWYYRMFRSYVENEREADRVLQDREHGTDDNAFHTQLEEAKRLWQTNLGMVDSFPYATEKLEADLDHLHKYALLQNRWVDLYLKSLEHDSYLFLDSLEYVSYDAARLGALHYKLDFYAPPKKEKKEPRLTPTTFYYDKDWNETSRSEAKYFRLAEVDSLFRVNGPVHDYYADTVTQMKGDYTNDIKDGIFFYFFHNGWYESAGRYVNDEKVGKWQNFYPNRQIRSEERYDMGNHRLENFWDENGIQFVSDGNGIYFEKYDDGKMKEVGRYKNGLQDSTWKGFYPDGKTEFVEQWQEGKLLGGTHTTESGKIVTYDKVYTEPQPLIGNDAYMRYIKDNTYYPVTKTNSLPEGILIIELTVDTDGTITDMRPYTKLGAGCEQAAMGVIKRGSKFLPARLRGIPIKEKTLIPFEYKTH